MEFTKKYVRWSIFLLKAPFLTFTEIIVPQDFTIRDAHGFRGPANTCVAQTIKFCILLTKSGVLLDMLLFLLLRAEKFNGC